MHRSVGSLEFQNFLHFIQIALREGSETERLLAVALACKVAVSAKHSRQDIERILASEALTKPLPPLKTLEDSDNRYYAASVWRFASRDWIVSFLALGALEEESAENTRRECIEGLVSRLGISNAFKALETKLPALRLLPESPKSSGAAKKRRSVPGDGMSRRMRRLVAAMNQSFALSHNLPEGDVGPNIRSFLRKAFEISGFPEDLTAKLELSKEILRLILLVARSRYALATVADTYSPMTTMRDWFTDWEWRELTDKDEARTVALSIQGALELLVRCGTVDAELFNNLVLASGSSETARLMTRQIAEQSPGLPTEIAAWLTGQPIRKRTALSSESQMVRIEEAIADALLASQSVARASELLTTDLVPQLSIYKSLPTDLLTDLLSSQMELKLVIDSLCDMRGLELMGSKNIEEEFAPLRHEFMNPTDMGARRIRILRPGVTIRREDGSLRIIRKALVVPS